MFRTRLHLHWRCEVEFNLVEILRSHRFQDVSNAAAIRCEVFDPSVARELVPAPHPSETLCGATSRIEPCDQEVVVEVQSGRALFGDAQPLKLRRAKLVA